MYRTRSLFPGRGRDGRLAPTFTRVGLKGCHSEGAPRGNGAPGLSSEPAWDRR